MPYSITLTLSPTRSLPHATGQPHLAPHALFYRWLEAADPDLVRFVHNQANPKPFTTSPLIAGEEDERYRLRVTLLEDDYWAYVEQGLQQVQTIRAEDKILAPDGEVQVTQRTYVEIAQSASKRRQVILCFESPTSFKSREMHYPLPDPVLVFASYHARWNAFAPPSLQIDPGWSEWLARHVAVSRFELSSEIVDFGRYHHVGCVGRVQYAVVGRGREVAAGLGPLNALADYATFCGTGHKTTQGMGQTRRVDGWATGDRDSEEG